MKFQDLRDIRAEKFLFNLQQSRVNNFPDTMKSATSITVRPARNLRGSVQLPGDKSISHRYAMLSGIAEGQSRLENYSTGADCASTLACMRTLGVNWERKDDGAIEVQ